MSVCYVCRQPGHFKKNCPKLARCSKCNTRGHFSRECFTLERCFDCHQVVDKRSQTCPCYTQKYTQKMPKEDVFARSMDWYFVIDVSSSMEGERLNQVKSALLQLIFQDIMKHRDRVGIMTFNENVWWQLKPTPLYQIRKNRDVVQPIIHNLYTYGNRAIYDAMATAMDSMYYPDSPTVLVVVTDGPDNASRTNMSRLLQILETRPHTRVYVLNCGDIANFFGMNKQIINVNIKEQELDRAILTTVDTIAQNI